MRLKLNKFNYSNYFFKNNELEVKNFSNKVSQLETGAPASP